jgi:NagD protein
VAELADGAAFLFDVDGTLVLADDPNTGAGGGRALDGAIDLLRALRAQGTPHACFTNGSGQIPGAVAARLRRLGLDVSDTQLLTPAVVAVEHIRHAYPGLPVLAFGTEGVLEPLADAAIPLAGLEDAARAEVVLIGADPDFTYTKLEAACRAVWSGAALLVTSMAPFFASSRGRMPSTSGAIAAGIRHVTGVEPIIVGKPSQLVLTTAANRLGCRASELVVVGDDLHLEIRMARDAGAASVLVLTGTSHASELAETSPNLRPDLVLPTVGDLLAHLHQSRGTDPRAKSP